MHAIFNEWNRRRNLEAPTPQDNTLDAINRWNTGIVDDCVFPVDQENLCFESIEQDTHILKSDPI